MEESDEECVRFMFLGRSSEYAADLKYQSQAVIEFVNAQPRLSSPRRKEARIQSWVRITVEQSNQDDTFPMFGRLPQEIQDMIWEFAILQLGRSLVHAGTYRDRRERDLNREAHKRDYRLQRRWQRQLADPALARTCRAARSRFLAASVNKPEYWTHLPKVRGVFLPHDSVFIDGCDGPLTWLRSTPEHQWPFEGSKIPNLPEIMLPWQGLRIAPRLEQTPDKNNTFESLRMWAKELRQYRKARVIAPNLKAIQVDFWMFPIQILLRHCPISGCRCHEDGNPRPARLQKADLVSVVDLFDNERIDELVSLGDYYKDWAASEGQQFFSPFQWMQWRWVSRGRDEVLLQWVSLQARKARKFRRSHMPNLDDPNSWVTWEGINQENEWVKGVMSTMPELKPVVRVELLTRHFSKNCAHYESYL